MITALRRAEGGHGGPSVGSVIVFSSSELIGDGVLGLLPREWRDRIAIVADLDQLRQRLDGQRAAVIIDADGADAAIAVRLTAIRGGTTIMLLGPGEPGLERDVLDAADAIIPRDEAEPLTLRTALAAGRLGMRLVPRSLSDDSRGSASINGSSLSDPARRALELLAEGKRDAEIAQQLNLSESAVRKLVQRTVRAVGARTRCQAVAIAARNGLTAPPDSS